MFMRLGVGSEDSGHFPSRQPGRDGNTLFCERIERAVVRVLEGKARVPVWSSKGEWAELVGLLALPSECTSHTFLT